MLKILFFWNYKYFVRDVFYLVIFLDIFFYLEKGRGGEWGERNVV